MFFLKSFIYAIQFDFIDYAHKVLLFLLKKLLFCDIINNTRGKELIGIWTKRKLTAGH